MQTYVVVYKQQGEIYGMEFTSASDPDIAKQEAKNVAKIHHPFTAIVWVGEKFNQCDILGY